MAYDTNDPNILTTYDIKNLNILTEQYQNISNRTSSMFTLPEISQNNVVKHHSNNKVIYSILINEDVPMSIFNLVIKLDQDGSLLSEKVYRYKMNPEFGTDYYQGDTGISAFEGRIQIFNPSQIFNLNRQNGECLEELDCCDIPSGGGSVSPSNGPGSNTGGGGGSTHADCIWIAGCSPCSCLIVCHPGCVCKGTQVRYFSFLQCDWPFTKDNEELTRNDDDCCPGNSDEIPTHPGIDPSTIGDEDTGPADFTAELQAGANSNSFLNNFLAGNTSL